MSKRKINFEYLNIIKEIPLFFKLERIKLKKPLKKTNRILIVNTCLIGEFVASLPAVRNFIKNNSNCPIDIIVSPSQKTLAEKIRGIRNVYVCESIYNRKSEKITDSKTIILGEYEKIIVLRISKDSYNLIKNIRTNLIKTSFNFYISYGLHLFKNLVFKKNPKQWWELNFEMLNEKMVNVDFDSIFQFDFNDYKKINELKELKGKKRIIFIHTGTNWPMKRWPNEKWIELLKKINKYGKFKLVFIGGGKEDQKNYNFISSKLNFSTFSLINKIDIKEMIIIMRILRKEHYFIGIDSGPKNMAHLADIRSISIMGPGPHMYMPYHEKDIVIDKSKGRGLYQMFFVKKIGFIHKIEVDEVYNAFKQLIKIN